MTTAAYRGTDLFTAVKSFIVQAYWSLVHSKDFLEMDKITLNLSFSLFLQNRSKDFEATFDLH
jgi:hypothetical protein